MSRKKTDGYLVPIDRVEGAIREIRRQKVVLDSDLAALYGVDTRALNQAVKRNADRFPEDFVFQLDEREFEALRSQDVTAKGRGGRRTPPFAFTEHGAVMVASILKTKRAAEVSVFVVRAFVRMRRELVAHRQIALKMTELERRIERHDASIAALFDAMRRLMRLPEKPRKPIGFRPEDK